MSEADDRGQRDREFGDEERFTVRERERMGAQWDDRSARWDDREDRYRSTEYYGQGQSGYAAGRYEGDRSYGSPDPMNPNWNERYPDRGGGAWRPDDRSMRHQHPGGGYGDQGGYLGQGGQLMGYIERGDRGDRGMYGRPGMQNRYGSQGMPSSGHRGKGPSGYTRSDDRIREIVCEILMDDDHIDASNIEVNVKNGEVTLSGNVEDRWQKRMAEDRIENVSGVKDVVNQLRVGSPDRSRSSAGPAATTSSTRENGHGETQPSSDKRHRA